MCGLVAYAGAKPASHFLLEGLKRLEYRGYDSCGLVTFSGSNLESLHRATCAPSHVDNDIHLKHMLGNVGLGHTRWATHGKVCERNTHPISTEDESVFVVHNGIIENNNELRDEMESRKYSFWTETDTEVIANLLNDKVPRGSFCDVTDLALGVIMVCEKLQGSYAFVAWVGWPGRLVAVSRGAPLVFSPLGHIASDPAAFSGFADRYATLQDGHIAIVTERADDPMFKDGCEIEFINPANYRHNCFGFYKPVFLGVVPPAGEAGSGGSRMYSEIHEQRETLKLTSILPNPKKPARVCLFGCGSSYYAAMVGRHFFERTMPVTVEHAAEFPFRRLHDVEDTLYVGLTQSGETKDTLLALDTLAAENARKLLVLTNRLDSTAATKADPRPLYCGREEGVAATKTFTAQLVRLYELSKFDSYYQPMMEEVLAEVAVKVGQVLGMEEAIKGVAKLALGYHTHLFLGRGIFYPIALEGALKMKEVAYKHAEAIHSSEMKHGPIALVDERTLSFFLLARQDDEDRVSQKVCSNISEICARNGKVVVFTEAGLWKPSAGTDDVISVVLPSVSNPLLQPIVHVVALQLLAYYVAVLQGINPDRPKNLAKSVTVE